MRLLTMHANEVEGMEEVILPSGKKDIVLDIKVLPNRAADMLSYRGIAKELAMLLDSPLKKEDNSKISVDSSISAPQIKNLATDRCPRYIGRIVKGVKVGPSPVWLQDRLAAIGQRSINNIVDIANYSMFCVGQPLHAFDCEKLIFKDGNTGVTVRLGKTGEEMTTLDGRPVVFDDSMLVISDDEKVLALAGIKGGNKDAVTESTTDLMLEAANFAPSPIRKTARALGLQTDASKRYENNLTPELAKDGMEMMTKMILELAGGKAGSVTDIYTIRAQKYKLGTTLSNINKTMGAKLANNEVENILNKFRDHSDWEWNKILPKEKVIETASVFVGKKYKNDASVTYDAPEYFNSSSLVAHIFLDLGFVLPRLSVDQMIYGKPIEKMDLAVGDLVFSNTGPRNGKLPHTESVEFLSGTPVDGGVNHVGLCMGDGKILHASYQKESVVLEDFESSELFKKTIGYRRILDDEERYVVTIPHERMDLRAPIDRGYATGGIEADFVEEIVRVYGYENIEGVLPRVSTEPITPPMYYWCERLRGMLLERGFSEITNYVFTSVKEANSVEVENPFNVDKPYLRISLAPIFLEKLELNVVNKDILNLPQIKLFEIGHVFEKGNEVVNLIMAIECLNKKHDTKKEIEETWLEIQHALGIEKSRYEVRKDSAHGVLEINLDNVIEMLPVPEAGDTPPLQRVLEGKFKRISPYPFITRDIAVFVPENTKSEELREVILKDVGEFFVRDRFFDTFTKTFPDGTKKVSYAYRLVFQSSERTLLNDEISPVMKRIEESVKERGWEVR